MEEQRESIQLNLLNIGYSELNANWNWKNVYSPFARLYYVKSGMAKTYIEDKAYFLTPGYLYLTPPFTLHHDECESSFSLFYIHFYEKTDNRESIFDKYDFPVKLKASLTDVLLIERLNEINPGKQLTNIDPEQYDNAPTFSKTIALNSKMPLHTTIETQSILSIIMSHFLEERIRKSTDKNKRIYGSIRYIHRNINQTISIKTLADMSCVSEDHYIRLFKKEMKLTPISYINSKKIEKAQLLLLTTPRPVRDIAMELAFDNTSYFNRIFKQHTQKTPKEYRKEYSNGTRVNAD